MPSIPDHHHDDVHDVADPHVFSNYRLVSKSFVYLLPDAGTCGSDVGDLPDGRR